MRKLLILENDLELKEERAPYVFEFLKTWDEQVLNFSGFANKTKEEIYNAVRDCTDIITQTCFVNGSDIQFESMVRLLSNIKNSKNIYIGYLGGSLFDYVDNNLTDEQLALIEHHKIYEIGYFDADFEVKEIDFSKRLDEYKQKLQQQKNYRDTGKQRITGRKIKILGCNASGKAFQNLSLNNIVDELDMSEQDPNPKRGVWIWGNGEPIKLINDCGLQEYEITTGLTANDLLIEIDKSTDFNFYLLNRMEIEGIISIINDEEISAMEAANFICEETSIEKRGNRQKIYLLISKYKNQFKLNQQ